MPTDNTAGRKPQHTPDEMQWLHNMAAWHASRTDYQVGGVHGLTEEIGRRNLETALSNHGAMPSRGRMIRGNDTKAAVTVAPSIPDERRLTANRVQNNDTPELRLPGEVIANMRNTLNTIQRNSKQSPMPIPVQRMFEDLKQTHQFLTEYPCGAHSPDIALRKEIGLEAVSASIDEFEEGIAAMKNADITCDLSAYESFIDGCRACLNFLGMGMKTIREEKTEALTAQRDAFVADTTQWASNARQEIQKNRPTIMQEGTSEQTPTQTPGMSMGEQSEG